MKNYKNIIETAKIAIEAIEFKLTQVYQEVNDKSLAINQEVAQLVADHQLFLNYDFQKLLRVHLSESLIRFTWDQLNDPTRTNSIDVYYYSNKKYDNTTDNHYWDISCPSNILRVNSDTSFDKLQYKDALNCNYMPASINDFIEINRTELIELHCAYRENQSRASDLQHSLDNLKRDIVNAETSIKRDTILRIFKPAGETAKCKIQEIDFPTHTYFYSSRRTALGFVAINIIKETSKGIRVEFINKFTREDGTINRYTDGKAKWVTIDTLINLYSESVERFNKAEKKRIAAEEATKPLVNA